MDNELVVAVHEHYDSATDLAHEARLYRDRLNALNAERIRILTRLNDELRAHGIGVFPIVPWDDVVDVGEW